MSSFCLVLEQENNEPKCMAVYLLQEDNTRINGLFQTTAGVRMVVYRIAFCFIRVKFYRGATCLQLTVDWLLCAVSDLTSSHSQTRLLPDALLIRSSGSTLDQWVFGVNHRSSLSACKGVFVSVCGCMSLWVDEWSLITVFSALWISRHTSNEWPISKLFSYIRRTAL